MTLLLAACTRGQSCVGSQTYKGAHCASQTATTQWCMRWLRCRCVMCMCARYPCVKKHATLLCITASQICVSVCVCVRARARAYMEGGAQTHQGVHCTSQTTTIQWFMHWPRSWCVYVYSPCVRALHMCVCLHVRTHARSGRQCRELVSTARSPTHPPNPSCLPAVCVHLRLLGLHCGGWRSRADGSVRQM